MLSSPRTGRSCDTVTSSAKSDLTLSHRSALPKDLHELDSAIMNGSSDNAAAGPSKRPAERSTSINEHDESDEDERGDDK